MDAPVMGSGDAGELLPPPGSGGRSWLQWWSLLASFSAEAFHRRHQEVLAAFPSIDCF
jgi:hypothetical protein